MAVAALGPRFEPEQTPGGASPGLPPGSAAAASPIEVLPKNGQKVFVADVCIQVKERIALLPKLEVV